MKFKLPGLVFTASILLVAGCTTTQAGPSAPAAPASPLAAEQPVSPPGAPTGGQNGPGPAGPTAPEPAIVAPKPAPAYNPNGPPYGINSTQTPAPLVLSNFTINPPGLRLFSTSNVSVVVTNTGTQPVSYGVTLGVRTASGGARATVLPGSTQQVDLAGGESKTVSFTIGGLGNGTHIVYIDQLWDRVSVDSQV